MNLYTRSCIMMSKSNKVVLKPILISGENKKLLERQNFNYNKLSNITVYTEEVIYQSKECDFLKGEPQEVTLVNRHYFSSKTCRTVAKCKSNGVTVETTSDNVCSLIGQNNYNTVLSALSSIFNEEIKVRGILALLKPAPNSESTQVDMKRTDLKDNSCQTNESYVNLVSQTQKKRKRLRKSQFSTYVVKESPSLLKKCVINIDDILKKENPENNVKEADPLPNLDHDPELSNLSCGSLGSISSFPSIPGMLERTDDLLVTVERSTQKDNTVNDTVIDVRNGPPIRIPIKPQDHFHLATPDILKHVTKEERVRLLQYQACIDLAMCLNKDVEGYYPLHVAVINDEVGMVRRQCLALRRRGETVDILVGDVKSFQTALHMAIRKNASSASITGLLHFGANPLLRDSEGRTGLHHAADADIATLTTVLTYCDQHARRVLQNNKEFWNPELDSKSDDELAKYLYEKAANICDDQGYTPLMLAANLARPEHVSALATRAPSKVDVTARSSGETALYRAVAAACLHNKNSSNRSLVPDKFIKTVEILVDNGADPSIENHSSSSVNSLLTEFNISSLSMAIANRMKVQTHRQLYNKVMLYKETDGSISLKNLKKEDTSVLVDNEMDTTGVNAEEVLEAGTYDVTVIEPEPKRIVKKFTIIAPKHGKRDDSTSLINKGLRLEMIKTAKKSVLKNDFKIKQDADKVIIVQNVKLDNISKATVSSNIEKPKNIVLTNPAERIVTINNRRKLKIAQELLQSDLEKITSKKRKLNEQ